MTRLVHVDYTVLNYFCSLSVYTLRRQVNSSIKHYIFLHMASGYTTSKNHRALSFERYSYIFDRLNARSTKKRLRCRTRDCNGNLYPNNDQDIADIVELSSSHGDHCIPDPERRFVEEVISDLKVKVRTL